MRILVLAALILLGACSEWNERRLEFPDYASYAASDVARGGFLPDDLLPRSARNISFVHNRDTTEVEVEFQFSEADRDAVVTPFLNYEQLQLRIALEEGDIPASALPPQTIFLRCGPGPMEFLKLDGAHARYWTDTDPGHRQESCTNRAASGAS